MNRIVILLLITGIGIGCILNTDAKAGGGKVGVVIRRDTVHSNNGRAIPALHLSSKHGFFAYIPSVDGRYTFLVMKKYSEAVTNWNAKGRILCFDHQKDSVTWVKKTRGIGFAVCNDHFLEYTPVNTNCYSQKNGEPVWQNTKGPLVFKDCGSGLGITYGGSIINMKTGQENKPGQRMDLRNGIDEVIAMPDGRTLISASGLTLLDTNHSIEACITENTGFRSTERVVANTAIILMVAGAMGSAIDAGANAPIYMASGVPVFESRVTGLCSNVVRREGRIYQAYDGKLVCYDDKLKRIWSTPFEKHRTGASRLHYFGDTLLLVSKGIGYLGTDPYKVGEPGIFLFEPMTGKLLNSIAIDSGGEGILDVTLMKNNAFLLTATEELTISLSAGKLIRRVKTVPTNNAAAHYVKPDPLRSCPPLSNDSCESLTDKNVGSRYIRVQGGILAMDGVSGRMTGEVPESELCFSCYENEKAVLIKCAKSLTLTDKGGRITESIPLKGDVQTNGNRMYFRETDKKSLRILEMNGVITSD